MARYIENGTVPELEVQVRGLPKWDGEPDLCEVTYPDGTVYGVTRATVERLFTIVSPQSIALGGVGGGAFDRPLPTQVEAMANQEKTP